MSSEFASKLQFSSSAKRLKRSPLHLAIALAKDYEITRILIDNGADISNRNTECKTPLHTFFSPTVDLVLRYHGDLFDLSAPIVVA